MEILRYLASLRPSHINIFRLILLLIKTATFFPQKKNCEENKFELSTKELLFSLLKLLFVCLFLQGVCQQQNVLFDFMTVKEHLHFYAGLKEVEAEERDDMVNMIFIFSY